MVWTKQYWDMLNQFYWSPQYIGLKSIPQNLWQRDGANVTIPLELVNPNGPLYRRTKKGEEYWGYVHRQEETFNHIFSLAFAMLPGSVIRDVLAQFTPLGDHEDFQPLGCEIRHRYGWDESTNITTPDGYFIGQGHLLAVELKFNAKTSPDQLAKYLLLMVSEEIFQNRKMDLRLLYIFSRDPSSCLDKQLGCSHEHISGEQAEFLLESTENGQVKAFLREHFAEFKEALDRLEIRAITWRRFAEGVEAYLATLGQTPGEQTLRNIFVGLRHEIKSHPLSKLETK